MAKLTESQQIIRRLQSLFPNTELAHLLGYGGKRPGDAISAISRGSRNLPQDKLHKALGLLDQYNVRKSPLSPKQIRERQKQLRNKSSKEGKKKPPTKGGPQRDRESNWREVSQEFFLSTIRVEDDAKLLTRLGFRNIAYYYWNPSYQIFWLSVKPTTPSAPKLGFLLYEFGFTKDNGVHYLQYPFYYPHSILGRRPKADETFSTLIHDIESYHQSVADQAAKAEIPSDDFYTDVLPPEEHLKFLAFVERV